MADRKRRSASAIDFKSLELANQLLFNDAVEQKESSTTNGELLDVENISASEMFDGVLKSKVQ